MVCRFSHTYKGREYRFLYDVESGSLHNVDADTFRIAGVRYDGEQNAGQAGTDDEINAELDKLECDGVLNAPVPQNVISRKTLGEVKALCLHICHDCNLRCSYCFADEGTYKRERESMSLDVGKKAIDFLLMQSGKRKNLEIDFFGGEPLMNIDTVEEIVKYAREREKTTYKKFDFTITTNCLLLSDRVIDFINRETVNVVLSVDGRREVHNGVRKTVNGKDCYDIITRNALKLIERRGNKSYYARGTFTSRNTDFTADVLALRDMGFKNISLEPVVLDAAHELAIKDGHIDTINREYDKLADAYLDACAEGRPFNFFHFMLDLQDGPCLQKRMTGCGAGTEYAAVLPNGDIYPCHQFASEDDYLLGNVTTGEFYPERAEKFALNLVTNKSACADCIAKYYCSGGCAANNTHYAGNINTPYSVSCSMMRKRFELSLFIRAYAMSCCTEDKIE